MHVKAHIIVYFNMHNTHILFHCIHQSSKQFVYKVRKARLTWFGHVQCTDN